MSFPKDLKAILVTPIVIGGIAVLVALLIPAVNRDPGIATPWHEVAALESAIREYHLTYSKFPPLDGLLQTIAGDNPRSIIFLEWPSERIGTSGEPIDSWGNPFKIEMTEAGILVVSAGSNGKFDDADDIRTKEQTPNHGLESTGAPPAAKAPETHP